MRLVRQPLLAGLFAAILMQGAAWAQNFPARITGGGGSGKCTFEVAVNGTNGVAEVEIRNDKGYLKTISGQPAQWRRLVCNQPLPRNPNKFRFQGIDGHGKQYLVRDPNSNGGTAVVRIENNRNGYEGYTGDILWDGSSNAGGGNGWNDGGSNNNNNNWGNSNSGSWTVQDASYGTNSQRRNVTNNVRRLVNGPDFQVTNANMGGDPAVGADKALYITARAPNGTVRTFTYAEGSTVSTQMFSGGGAGWNNNNNRGNGNPGSWTVQDASYGTNSQRKNVTGTVRRLVNGPDFRVTNANMGGDPVVGADKTLYITARDLNGTVRTFTYGEGATVSTQLFSGGGGGGGWGGNNQWNNNTWNQNVARNGCQNAIRSQLVGKYGGTLNFTGNPSQDAAGGGVRVRGTAHFRDGNGKNGNIEYMCAMDMNGRVKDATYQVTNSH